MKRRVQVLVALIALAIAAPATAQRYKRRDRRQKKPVQALKVTSWAPKSGPVGTKIVIEGSGFSRRTTVLFGGRKLRPQRVKSNLIWLIVPKRYGNGSIVLRNPGYGSDYKVGSYQVVLPPVIKRMAPNRGVYGTRVELLGRGFQQGDIIKMGGRAINVIKYSSNRLVIEIPDWATDNYITVHRDSYAQRSRRKFNVLDPAPIVSSVQPDYGPPGSTVRLNGRHFTNRDRVWYGRIPTAVVSRGKGWIEVVVPRRAARSRYFRVKGPGGETRSPQAYNLELPPYIKRYSPSWGNPGSRVDIYGSNFKSGDKIQLNGQWLKIVQLRPGQITVRIPKGARSGKFMLARGRAKIYASSAFEVAYAPTLSGWGPKNGEWGTKVTLRGSGYDNSVKVLYGNRPIRIARRVGDHTIEVLVPKNRGNQLFHIKGKYGGVKTGRAFNVEAYPVLTDARPRRGYPGDRITLRGRNLANADGFWLGNTKFSVIRRQRNNVIVEVPKNARNGRITWKAYGKSWSTDWEFGYDLPVEFSGYSPSQAWPGDEITVRGRQFNENVDVLYGNQPLSILNWKPNQIRVRLPKNLRGGSNWLWVKGKGYKHRSDTKLRILASPTFGGYGPSWGRVGTRITLRGTNFTKNSRVTFGSWSASVIQWKPSSLVIEVPSRATAGKHWIWVEDRNYKQKSRRQFQVKGYAAITGLSAKQLAYGESLIIQGTDFNRNVRAFYGNTELSIRRRGPRGRRLWVTIPKSLSGSDWIYVEDDGHKSRSPYKFGVRLQQAFNGYGPAWGRAGTRVTLRGQHFTKNSRVRLGRTNLGIVSWKANQLVVEVPKNAAPGQYWFWVQDGRWKQRSAKKFVVKGYASVRGLSARNGWYGETLIIQGAGFHNNVRAFYGNTELNIKRRGKRGRRLWVDIPEGLKKGADWIYIEDDGNKARSPYKFAVKGPKRGKRKGRY